MGLIKQLKQFITGTQIFPITKTNAVYDDNLGRLDTFMQKFMMEEDVLEGETDDLPRDADTLCGHELKYFAKQSDMEGLSKDLGGLTIVPITKTAWQELGNGRPETNFYIFTGE